MKITSKQLRDIIAEEVRALRAEAHILQADNNVHNVTQVKNSLSNVEGGPEFRAAVDRVGDVWRNFYSEEDPSMSAAGPDGWEAQVDRACGDLEDKIADLVISIGNGLLNGKYGR